MTELLTPFKDLLPPLSTDEFDALKKDINANGVRDKLILTEDREILDGHNRYKIKKDAPTHTVKGSGKWSVEQKHAYVIATAFRRRNLSLSQMTDLRKKQKKLCKSLKGQDKKHWTDARLGSMLGVDRSTVTKWIMPDVKGHNTYKKPDARVKLNQPAKDVVAKRVEAGETQEQVAADFGVTQPTVSGIVKAKKKNKAAIAVDQASADESTVESFIYHSDFREATSIEPNSIDLIFTDPPYDEDSIPLYGDLAAFAIGFSGVSQPRVSQWLGNISNTRGPCNADNPRLDSRVKLQPAPQLLGRVGHLVEPSAGRDAGDSAGERDAGEEGTAQKRNMPRCHITF